MLPFSIGTSLDLGTCGRPGRRACALPSCPDDLGCAPTATDVAGADVVTSDAEPANSDGPSTGMKTALRHFYLGVRILDGSSISAGTVLRFSVTGDGIFINPETGELSLLTGSLLEGFSVTVTLADESGTVSRVLRLAMDPVEAAPGTAPQPTAQPILEGTGEIGTVVTVDPGQWSGTPDPEIALQWCLDGEAIAGAAAAEYAPAPADDGRSLSCRVTARNAAGSASAEAESLEVRFPAPTAVDLLADLVASEGDEPLVVEAAAAFAGDGLTFAVTGAEATIDAATGRVTIPTAAPRAAEMLTVTATNSGGSASVDFQVTIEARAADVPARIPATLWSAEEVRDEAPEGRRRVWISPDVAIPAGFELRLYSGPERLASQPGLNTTRAMQPGNTFTTSGSLSVGTVCHNLLFWRRLEDGEWAQASQNTVVFEIAGLKPAEAAEPLLVAPAVLSAPVLAGSGKIDSELAVDTGTWSGEPEISLQWLRDQKPIPDATAAVYVPVPEDDLTKVCCRVTGRNAAGETAAETEAVRVTYVAPVPVGELPDEIFDEDTGAQEVPTAQAFEGQNLAFTVTGAWASIDAATGVVTIDTATPGAETIKVAAVNSGGEARQSFLVTVEALPAIQPEPSAIAPDLWLFEAGVWSAERGGAQMSITTAAAIKVPHGYELRCYIGSNSAGVGSTSMTRALVPGTRFTTNGFFSGDLHARLFWREMASDVFLAADDGGKSVRVGATPPAQPSIPGALPPWDVVVNSEAALKQQIAAHSNEATSWRVGLAPGDYGTLTLADIRSVAGAPVIIGSADYDALGAKMSNLNLTNSDRLHFEFIDVDRAGLGTTFALVDGRGSRDCGLQWSRVRGGAWDDRTANAQGYRANFGILTDSTSLRSPARFHVRHCAVGGHLGKAINHFRGAGTFEVIGCVFFDMGGDDMYVGGPSSPGGSAPALIFRDNWGSRRRRIYDPGGGAHDHNDFFQCFAGRGNVVGDFVIRGNVYLADRVVDRTWTPQQGIAFFDNPVSHSVFEQNIVASNSVHAITANFSGSSSNLCRNNTAMRVINADGEQLDCMIRVSGTVSGSGRNIHQNWNISSNVSGPDSITVARGTGMRQYYGGANRLLQLDPFIHYAPVSGQVTHWGAANPVGAAVRFREVLVEDKHPGKQPGPVAQYWRTQYDPQNQITSL
jgi:hypothetical protein